MTRHSILEYAAALRPRHLNASRVEKSAILSEFCQLTGYHRKAAIRPLRRGPTPDNAERRGRPQQYALTLVPDLVTFWEASERLCSKRLATFNQAGAAGAARAPGPQPRRRPGSLRCLRNAGRDARARRS